MPNLDARIPATKMPTAILPRGNLPASRSYAGEGDWERITPETRARVWKKRFGFRSTGTCVCCYQKTIRRDDFVCGYRRASAGGGMNDVSNLEPICSRCSERMGTHDLVSWCKKIQNELKTVKPMPKTTIARKTVRKTTAKKSAPRISAAKNPVRRAAAKKSVSRTSAAKKPVRRVAAKKPASKKAKR
jgi:hypothetical protein